MSEHTHARVKRLFNLLISTPAADRPDVLDRECAGDPALRRRIESMVAGAEEGDFLASPTLHAPPDHAGTLDTSGLALFEASTAAMSVGERPGTQIGPYKLLHRIGEGGFGVVFMAEQSQPVRRKVALKVIKLGMDSRQVVARFEQERQALAMMDHPGIAKVFDGGVTEHGRPYFVMELVSGEPIIAYSDRNLLSIGERLKLFAQVCNAVQHAHTKGVIHRDIKPGNILVSTQDARPYAKVIDFGIAKATHARLTEKTLFTELNHLIGTPEYMSPAQAEGSLDIDTRTDVYSLGVLLYELLTGTTPFSRTQLRLAGYSEIQRIIREVDPPKPSTRISQNTESLAGIATLRRTDPRRLSTLVKGDLDWIAMKALDKDRTRRYDTASGLMMDIQRCLDGESVVAAPPSRAYCVRKFVRRNTGAVLAALAIAAALLLGVVGFAWQARVALAQRDRAVAAEAQTSARAEELKKVSDFQSDMLAQVDPAQAGVLLSRSVTAKLHAALAKAGLPEDQRAQRTDAFAEQWALVNPTDIARELIDATILTPAVKAIDHGFIDQPLLDAKLRNTLGTRYLQLGLDDAALALQTSALATRRRILGDDHPVTLESLSNLAAVVQSQGRLADAERTFRDCLQRCRRALGDEHPLTLSATNNLGNLLEEEGRLDEAAPLLHAALESMRRVLGPDSPEALGALGNYGLLLESQGKLEEAESCLREALGARRRTLGDDHPATLNAANNLGTVLSRVKQYHEAERIFRQTLETRRRVIGEEHPDTLTSINNLANLLSETGRSVDAEPFYRQAVTASRRILGEDHPNTLGAISNLGALLQQSGRLDEAEPFRREALQKCRRVLGEDHLGTMSSIAWMGLLLRDQGKLLEAEPLLREAHVISARVLGPDHLNTISFLYHDAGVLVTLDRAAEAVELLVAAEPAARRVFAGPNTGHLCSYLTTLGAAHTQTGDFIAAEANLLEAQSLARHRDGSPATSQPVTMALAALFDARDKAEPGKGYDAKAAACRAALEALQQPATPAPPPP
jgi:serine/threonine protein kinase/tetratricopeptide (TPR) repeat protein